MNSEMADCMLTMAGPGEYKSKNKLFFAIKTLSLKKDS